MRELNREFNRAPRPPFDSQDRADQLISQLSFAGTTELGLEDCRRCPIRSVLSQDVSRRAASRHSLFHPFLRDPRASRRCPSDFRCVAPAGMLARSFPGRL